MSKPKQEPRSWEIRWTGVAHGRAYVTARNEDEAIKKFDAGDWDAEGSHETTDVERDGEPVPNE